MHKQQGWLQAWEYCQAKPIQILGRASQGVDWSWRQCIKSHHTQTSSGKGLPSHFWNRKIVQKHLTWAKEKKNWTVAQWSKVLFSDKSKFCFSFENQGLEEDWRGTESMLLEVQREVSEVSDDLGCRDVCWCPLCFIKSKVNAAIYQEILEHFMLPSAVQTLWRCWFPFPAGL